MKIASDDYIRKNILPNTYIPVLLKKILANILVRLPVKSLIQLTLLWPRLIHTQPHLIPNGADVESKSQKSWNKQILNEIRDTYTSSAGIVRKIPPKRKLIDKILYEYWSKGLNLLQISQVDCQLIVDRSNSYQWILSKVKDRGGFGQEVPVLLDPQGFLNQLALDLNTLYMTYVYVCRHPTFPLIIIRIQVFDLQPRKSSQSLDRPHILSHRPYFVAIPMNSPHIIHSPGEDMISKIVLQAIERTLLKDPSNILKLETSKNQKPVRSLESMHILKGNSRFGSSLGIWTSYADGTVDNLPFAAVENHKLVELIREKEEEEEPTHHTLKDEFVELKKIANLRFKGNIDGQLKSDRLYDDVNPPSKKRRKRATAVSFNRIDGDDDEDGEGEDKDLEKNEFSSIAPVQSLEFTLADKISGELDDSEENEEAGIVMKLSGSDIFAGLHELSIQFIEKEKMILNPEEVPGWLTGEEGANGGIIKNGRLSVN